MAKKTRTVQKKVKRKHIRFSPDEGTLAFILTDAKGQILKTPIPCLVIEESYAGCSLISVRNAIFEEGVEFKIKVGKLAPLKAQVRWIKNFYKKVSYVGISYLE